MSKSLKSLQKSIACLAVSHAEMDMHLERLLIKKQRDKSRSSTAKILEINPKHEIIEKINHDLNLGHYSNDNSELIKLMIKLVLFKENQYIMRERSHTD